MIKISKTSGTIIKVLLLFGLFIGFNACKKDFIDWAQLQQDEINAREQYLLDSGITVEPKESGLYYIVKEGDEGTGLPPTAGRLVQVNYKGWLLDGTEFDSGEEFSFTYGVGAVIPGWDEALSYMKKGGKAQLIIPSSLAYGQLGKGDIPRYATLVFDIELLNVQ